LTADAYQGRRVVITGGLGFIGSSLACALAGRAQVTVIDSLDPLAGGDAANLDGIPVEVVRADIRDAARVGAVVAAADVVFNLAARSGHLLSMRDPLADLDANCAAQLAFLDACRARGPALRLVFTSTRQVYGRAERLPVDESHPLAPTDINAIHKLAAEHYHRLTARLSGAEVTILRLTNVYGPRQSLRTPLAFFPTFLAQALAGRDLTIYDGGKLLRDLLFVDDAVDALLLAGSRPEAAGETFNIGSGDPLSLRTVAERVLALAPGGRIVEQPLPVERRGVDIGDYYTDASHAARLLGWQPNTTLEDGLQKTIAHFRR
jgi:nucleoside-diphosphate-sugar epimerase